MANSAPKTSPLDPSLVPRDPENPIQPGQFVTATSEDGIFKQPPPPFAPTSTDLASQSQPMQAQPSPGLNLASSLGPSPNPPQPHPASPPVSEGPTGIPPSVPPAQFPPQQPNPAPFVPPTSPPIPESPSTIKKLRTIIIIVALLLFVGLAGAIIWFVVLGKSLPFSPFRQPAEIQEPENTQTEVIPTPPPKRTIGGFADLPPATGEANPATASATPQATPSTQ